MHGAPSNPIGPPPATSTRLSYKFQRLRERLRQAIVSGELSGKLPGERELGKRFDANPKTLSKALTDLAGEGLLERSIGRGTFVKGQEPATHHTGKWMLLCDENHRESALARQLLQANPDAQVITDPLSLRPSCINQFDTVLDLNPATPESFRRAMIVRGMTLVRVSHEAGQIVVHTVVPDRTHAAWTLSRDMFLAGHRRILVVAAAGDSTVPDAVRVAATRFCTEAVITVATPEEMPALVNDSITAILCDGETASQAVHALAADRPEISHKSIGCVGLCGESPAWSGICVTAAELAQATFDLLRDLNPHRPCVLHLAGRPVDRGTLHGLAQPAMAMSA